MPCKTQSRDPGSSQTQPPALPQTFSPPVQGSADRWRLYGPKTGTDGDDGGHANLPARGRVLREGRAGVDRMDQVLLVHLLG